MILHSVPCGPGPALFKIEGQLDFAGAATVREALAQAAEATSCGRMLIDLADVRIADEKGVAALAAAVHRIHSAHPDMRVAVVTRSGWLAGALSQAAVHV